MSLSHSRMKHIHVMSQDDGILLMFQMESYLQHEKYSIPYTKLFRYIAFHVLSKLCSIGPAKMSGGEVKKSWMSKDHTLEW